MLSQNVGPANSETFSITYDRVAGRALHLGSAARLLARVRSGALDRALIAGADPSSSPQLAARSTRLTSPSFRRLIADGLERLLQAAHGPQRRWWAATRRDAVLVNDAELRDLVDQLRAGPALYARGIAILAELLSDGTGPAYFGDADELTRQLHRARAALQGGEPADLAAQPA